jgi:tetratricopeptide (TPR) repeat protein
MTKVTKIAENPEIRWYDRARAIPPAPRGLDARTRGWDVAKRGKPSSPTSWAKPQALDAHILRYNRHRSRALMTAYRRDARSLQGRMRVVVASPCVILLATLAAGCAREGSRKSDSPPPASTLLPLQLPELSTGQQAVRKQVEAQVLRLNALLDSDEASRGQRADAFGDLGKLLLAGGHAEAAVSALQNAQTLAPTNTLWPYYLGHAHRERNDPASAITAFQRVRVLDPTDVQTLIWLAEMQMAAGRPDGAVEPLRDALARVPGHPRALAAMGAAELARKDHAAAARHLEEALAVAPQAGLLHYQLSLAYRALGDIARADGELARRGTGGVPMSDARLDELESAIDSAVVFDRRSRQALARGNWEEAIAEARRGLEAMDISPSLRATLHHRLGTALAQTGNHSGAKHEFVQAIEAKPEFSPAHYSLALLQASEGKRDDAIEALSTALRFDPSYLAARLARADMLRETRRFEDALTDYRIALRTERSSPAARFGEALSMLSLGRHEHALTALEDAVRAHPNDPSLSLALARVLAGTPDKAHRDTIRALSIAEATVRRHQTLQAADTLAFVLAASGRFDEATTLGRKASQEARRQHLSPLADAVAAAVRYYQRHELPGRLWLVEPSYERSL